MQVKIVDKEFGYIGDSGHKPSVYWSNGQYNVLHNIWCLVTYEIKLDDFTKISASLEFQTGETFDGGDYNRPSNKLSPMSEAGSLLLFNILNESSTFEHADEIRDLILNNLPNINEFSNFDEMDERIIAQYEEWEKIEDPFKDPFEFDNSR